MASVSGGPRCLASEIVALHLEVLFCSQCSETCADGTIIFALLGCILHYPNWKTRLDCSSCGFASGELAEGLPMHFMRPGGANLPLQIQNILSFLADFALLIYVQDFGKGQFHMGFYFYHEYKHCTDVIYRNFIWNPRSWRRQTGLDVGSEVD